MTESQGKAVVERIKNTVTLKWMLLDEYTAMLLYDKLTASLAAGNATITIDITTPGERR